MEINVNGDKYDNKIIPIQAPKAAAYHTFSSV